jgi:nicotinamidase-related amidase
MYTLVVIDMQPDFVASQNKLTIYAVSLLIEQAVKDGANIVVLEYRHHEPTDWRIADEYKGYDKVVVLTKWDDDGSEEMESSGEEFDTNHFILCGVNTSACVNRTALGLRERYPEAKIEVKLNACNQPSHHNYYTTEALNGWLDNNIIAAY